MDNDQRNSLLFQSSLASEQQPRQRINRPLSYCRLESNRVQTDDLAPFIQTMINPSLRFPGSPSLIRDWRQEIRKYLFVASESGAVRTQDVLGGSGHDLRIVIHG